MLRQSKLIFSLAAIAIVTIADSRVDAFQVFSNSRPAASANRPNPRTATGTISRGNRHGLAGGLANHQWSYNSPNGQFRSNTYRRSTSSFGSANQSPVFHNYLPGTLNRAGTTTYHSGPTRIQRRSGVATFSGPGYYDPTVPGYNGVAVGGVIVNGGSRHFGHRGQHYNGRGYGGGPVFFVDPIAGPTFSPYAAGYPWVPGGQIPFGIYAPPIVLPYLNQGVNLNIGANVLLNNAMPNPALFGEAPAPAAAIQPQPLGEDFSEQITTDETPVLNEFPAERAPTDTVESSAVSRIRSLRYQTSGDTFYREADFASAEALYLKAGEVAPDRQAPWLRLAFTQVSLNKHAEAVRSLKAALNRNDDPSAAWIDSDLLAGKGRSDRSLLSEEQLFAWLKQRPNSTDRLLLAAAWSEFRGSSSAARELLQMARNAGLGESIARNLETVISNRHEEEVPGMNPKRDVPQQEEGDPQAGGAVIDSFTDADIQLLPKAASSPESGTELETEPLENKGS